MEMRRIGDLEVSVVGLGCNNFGIRPRRGFGRGVRGVSDGARGDEAPGSLGCRPHRGRRFRHLDRSDAACLPACLPMRTRPTDSVTSL